MVTATVAIVIYAGIAVYVVTHRPHRTISWVFGAFSTCVAGYYLCHLFLLRGPEVSYSASQLPLRTNWVVVSFAPTLFLHLTSFYWPLRWRRYQVPVLVPAYLTSVFWAYAALFTNLVVDGFLHRPSPSPLAPHPGPLMPLVATAFAAEVLVALVCLAVAYGRIQSSSLRRQMRQLSLPIAVLVAGAIAAWAVVLTEGGGGIPRQLIDVTLLTAGFLLARAVLRHGTPVGRPLSWRCIVYASLTAVVLLGTLHLTIILDRTLTSHTPFPYPLTTGILFLVVAVGGVPIARWMMRHLDTR